MGRGGSYQAEIEHLLRPDGRFAGWIDRTDLRGLTEEAKLDDTLLAELGISGTAAVDTRATVDEFLAAAKQLESEVMRPVVSRKGDDGYFKVPARGKRQTELKKEFAIRLAKRLGDPAKALAVLQLVSRDYNAHGELASLYRIFEVSEGGQSWYEVERVGLSKHAKHPMSKISIASANSLAGLPMPFSAYFKSNR
jgi:hypothetical protein